MRISKGNKTIIEFGQEREIELKAKDRTSIQSMIERVFAQDVTPFYDRRDRSLGLEFKVDMEGLVYQSNEGIVKLSKGKVIQEGTSPDVYCIRYVADGNIRSVYTSEEEKTKRIGLDLTRYTSDVEESEWARIEEICNRAVGYNFVDFNSSTRDLQFHIKEVPNWSESSLKVLYMLVSEAVTAPSNMKIMLLGDIEENKDEIIEALKMLNVYIVK